MSNTARGTILCTWVLTLPLLFISLTNPHIHTGVIFQRQSPFIFFTYNSKRTRIWQFHAQNKKFNFDPKWRAGCGNVFFVSCKYTFWWQAHPRKLVWGLPAPLVSWVLYHGIIKRRQTPPGSVHQHQPQETRNQTSGIHKHRMQQKHGIQNAATNN